MNEKKVNLDEPLHTKVKIEAAKEKRSMKDFLTEAIELYLDNRKASS